MLAIPYITQMIHKWLSSNSLLQTAWQIWEPREARLIRSAENVSNGLTFSHLYRQGVTSTQLLSWLALIDIAERYEKDAENSTEVFCNCSSP